MIELALLGLAVGVLMGLTGAGGGVLAVPGLMLVLHWEVAQAAPLAMLAVMLSASLGAWGALRDKLARYKAAILMAVAAMPFSSLGIQLAQWFAPVWLSGLFAVILLYIASRQLQSCRRHRADTDGSDAVLCQMNWETGKLEWTWRTVCVIAGIGAVTGFLTGLLGVGGAFFMVPMLTRFTNIPLQGVIATVLLVMAMISTGSLILAHLHGVAIPVAMAAPFVIGAMAGMLVGRHYVQRFSPRALQCSFGLLVLVVGLGVGLRTLLAL